MLARAKILALMTVKIQFECVKISKYGLMFGWVSLNNERCSRRTWVRSMSTIRCPLYITRPCKVKLPQSEARI